MPRIPNADNLGYSVPRARAQQYTDDSGVISSRSSQQLASTIANVAGALQAKQDKFNYAQAKSSLLQADIAARKGLENDQDWQTYEKRYSETMTKALESAGQMIRGRSDRALFDMDAKLDVERGLGEIRGLAKRKEIDTGRAELDSLLDNNRTMALEASDEATRSAILRSTIDSLSGAADKGYLGQNGKEEAGRLGRSWSTSYAEGFVDVQPLARQVEILRSPKGTPAELLAPDRRANLLRQAENSVRIEQERLEARRKSDLSEVRQTLNDQVRDGVADAKNGLAVKFPSESVFISAFGESEGARKYKLLRNAASLSGDIAAFHQIPSSEILARAESYRPNESQPGADQDQIYGFVTQTAREILAQRKADPAQYLIDHSPAVSDAWNALGTSPDGTARRYFNAVEAEKQRLGIVSPDVLPASAKTGSNQWQELSLLAANKYRELPQQASKWADGALRSNDPETVTQAAQLLDAVDSIAPGAYHGISQESKTKAALVSSMLNSGADPKVAVQVATDQMKVPENVRADRNTTFRKTVQPGNRSALNSFIDRDFDPGLFVSQPGAVTKKLAGGTALQTDFDRQVASYYQTTGDVDIARQQAWNDIRRVYGPTRVNGENVLTPFPVERFGVTPEDVRKDIDEFLKGSDTNASDVVLVADSDTFRQVDDALSGKRVQPTYRLVNTKTGDLLRKLDGTPQRYALPSSEELLQKYAERQRKEQEEGEAAVRQAKADRELRLRLEALRRAGELR